MKIMLKKGFTLIELLVVITIIGILATGAVTTFTSQLQKARDTTRVSDVKALQSAIEQYYQDNSLYPLAAATFTGTTAGVGSYMQLIPSDSKNALGCSGSGAATSICGYVYNVAPDNNNIANSAYEVSTAFEADANIKSKASASEDAGSDPTRYEVGTLKTGSTATAIATVWATGAAPAAGINVTR